MNKNVATAFKINNGTYVIMFNKGYWGVWTITHNQFKAWDKSSRIKEILAYEPISPYFKDYEQAIKWCDTKIRL